MLFQHPLEDFAFAEGSRPAVVAYLRVFGELHIAAGGLDAIAHFLGAAGTAEGIDAVVEAPDGKLGQLRGVVVVDAAAHWREGRESFRVGGTDEPGAVAAVGEAGEGDAIGVGGGVILQHLVERGQCEPGVGVAFPVATGLREDRNELERPGTVVHGRPKADGHAFLAVGAALEHAVKEHNHGIVITRLKIVRNKDGVILGLAFKVK